MQNRWSLLGVLFSSSIIFGWSGGEPSGEKPVFFGKLVSQEESQKENPVPLNVTNITIGRNRDGGRSVKLYEMPAKKSLDVSKRIILSNPNQDLTTTDLDLLKVNKIEVLETESWKWKKETSDARTPGVVYEFIELAITWKDNQTIHYLLELGIENTTKPIKVFCDSTDERPIEQPSEQGKSVFCSGVKTTELRKKGAPFPAIKELVIEGHCYEPPKNGSAGDVKPVMPPAA